MMSLTLYLCRKNTFPGQMRCIFFSVSPRDREFPKTGHKMLAKWGIRLPNQFLSHNTLLQSKNQAKVAYFTKLMILIFGCPEEIRITNFTRMPLNFPLSFIPPFSRPPSTPGLHHKSHSHNSSFSQLFFSFLFQFHLCHLFRPRLHLESHLPFGSFQLNLYLTWIILFLSNLEILL